MDQDEGRCPSCRAPLLDATPGAPYRCVFCKHAFTVPAATAPSPSASATRAAKAGAAQAGASATKASAAPVRSGGTNAGAATQAKPTSSGKFLALAALGIIAALGAVINVRVQSESAPSAKIDPGIPTPVFVPPSAATDKPPAPVPPVEPTVAPPTAALGEVVEGTTSIGGRFWIADYTNTGTVTIDRPSIVVSGFDAAGGRLVEQPGYATRARLEPGERTVVLALLAEPPAGLTRTEVVLHPPTVSAYIPPEVVLEVTEFAERATFGSMHQLVGTVHNTSPEHVRFVRLVAVGRDAAGRPVSFTTSIPSQTELDADQSSGFTLPVGVFEAERPARWELVAVGQPG